MVLKIHLSLRRPFYIKSVQLFSCILESRRKFLLLNVFFRNNISNNLSLMLVEDRTSHGHYVPMITRDSSKIVHLSIPSQNRALCSMKRCCFKF